MPPLSSTKAKRDCFGSFWPDVEFLRHPSKDCQGRFRRSTDGALFGELEPCRMLKDVPCRIPASIALSAAHHPVSVGMGTGAVAAHSIPATGIALSGGSYIGKHISERAIGMIGGSYIRLLWPEQPAASCYAISKAISRRDKISAAHW